MTDIVDKNKTCECARAVSWDTALKFSPQPSAMTSPDRLAKRAYLLSFFGRHYHRIMKLKCKARRYLSLFSCNCVSHMTNYVNFKLSKDVEKNPGPTQYNTDHHEVIIRPFMQNHSSTMQLNPLISSENLMQ